MKAPIFVKIERYKEIADAVSQARDRLDEAEAMLKKINDLKRQEDQEVASWQTELETIQHKIDAVANDLTHTGPK